MCDIFEVLITIKSWCYIMGSLKLMLAGVMLALIAIFFSSLPLIILGVLAFLAGVVIDLIRRDWTKSGKF